MALTTAGLSAATAADLPQAPPPAPIIAAPIFTWTGFYAGVNAGWGWRDSNRQSVILGGAVPGTLFFPDNGDGGFTGGGQIGYNYQIGSLVIGLETDIQWADTDQDETVAFLPAGVPGTFVPGEFRSNLSDWYGTVRARVGYSFDRFLPYVTGGFAYGNVKNKISDGVFAGSNDNTQYGWTVGAGLEYAFTNNLTAKLEYLYVDLDKESFNVPGGTFTSNVETKFSVVRAGLNYKF